MGENPVVALPEYGSTVNELSGEAGRRNKSDTENDAYFGTT